MKKQPRNLPVNGLFPGASLPFLPIPGWWVSKPRSRRRSRTLRFDALEKRVVLATAVWQAQGPGVTENGQAEGITSQNNPVVGAVHTVIAHPTNADIMWIGAVNGGIWRTNNATATTPVWTPQTDQQPGMSMGALHLDVTDATSNTLLAGIGRFSSLASDGGARVGLLRTTDGGTNWTQITGGGTLLGKNISGVAAWGNTIVVSVNIADSFTFGNIGIFRSTNGGASFTQISSGSGAATGLPGGVAYDLVTDPSDSNVLYTSIHFADIVGGLNGVYKSTNRGANWSKVSNSAMDALLNIGTTNNLEMAVGSSNNVYAAIVNQGQLAGLFRSGNGGTTWTQLDTPQTNENGTLIGLQPRQKGPGPGSAPEAVAGSQGSTHQSIAADPNNANVVYLGGDRQPSRTSGGVEIGTFPNSLGAQNYSGRLFRVDASLAAGSQVSSLTHQIGVATTLNSAPHADSRDMTFDVLGRLIEVNDGGVYRRGNPSGIGDWIGLMGQSLQVTEFHSLGYDPVSNIIIGGTQDTGTPYQTAPGSMVFTEILQGDGGVVQVDAQTLSGSNQSIRYMSFQNFQAFRREVRNASGGLVSASNPGLIVAGSGGLTLRSFDNTVQFYQPYELNAVVPSRAVIGTQDLYETTDQFANLTRIVDNTSSSISAMAYGGTGNADVIYYGNANGQLFVRTTAGGAFAQRTALVGGSQRIRDIALDSRDWQTAFVVDTNQVFMTTDSGATFADVTGNLLTLSGGAAPRTITFLVGAGLGGIVVGTDRGAYFSTSTAYNSWQQYGAGLPNVPVTDLRYNATDDVLTAGTLGRGAWMVSSASSTLAPAGITIVQSSGTTDVTEGGATDSFTVVLTAQPTTDVVLSVTSGNTLQATGSPTSLTFTSANWNVPRTVTVTAVNDGLVDGTVNVAFTVAVVDSSSDDFYDSVADQVVTVITRDDDVTGLLVVQSGGTTDVTEGGATDSFTVALSVQPTTDVVVSVTSGNTLHATGSPTSLTFTSANWNSPQTVTVTAVDDSRANGTVNVPFIVAVVDASSDDLYDSVADVTVTVIKRDNDVAGLSVVELGGTTDVTEGGATDSFTVVLTSQPATDVVVSVTSGNTLQTTGSPTSLTFTSVNWNIAQTVTVTAVDDSTVDGTANVPFTVAVVDASSDDDYDSVADVIVTVITRDRPNRTPTALGLSNTTFAENVATGTGIGNFTTTDPDAGNSFTYTLETGTGSADNGSFQIVGDELRTNAAFDFETRSTYSILVRTTDQGGLFFEQQFTITVTDVNEQPTALALSNSSIAENVVLGTAIGNFATTDPDAANTLTYTLETGTGSADNGLFQIVGDELRTNAALDFETQSTYTIRVRTTDQDGLFFEQQFTITVTNVNEQPTALVLSNATIAENVVLGTAIGSFTTTDPDAANTFTYTLVAGTGSTDNGSFQIVGDELRTNAALDFETRASYSIRVRTADQGGLSFEQQFTITVTDVNEAPTVLALSNATIAENVVLGTAIGNFTSTDPDAASTFTYTLVTGAGSTGNGSFQIVGDELRTNATLDFETQPIVTIRVRTTDQGGQWFEQQFTITVTNVNEQPAVLALSGTSVAENVALGTLIGSFSTTDPDAANTFTYTLVAGAGSTNNASFQIVGNQLLTNAAVDFETRSWFTIRVRTTDQGGHSLERTFAITVSDINETPTALHLTNTIILENADAGTAIGAFITTDPDVANTFTYALVPGAGSADNASFTIAGNQLRSNAVFNFEARPTYSIRVRTTDQNNLSFESAFTITVTNVSEIPTGLALSASTLAEGVAAGTPIGTFTTADPDVGGTFTYSLVAEIGSTDNTAFAIVGNQLRSAVVFNFEAKPTYSIRIRTTDQSNLSIERSFTISVTNVNEAPVLNNAGDVFTVLGVGSRQSAEMRQGTLVSEILARGAGGNPISDPDNGALRGIALTNIDRTLGTFQYTLVTNSPSEGDWVFVEQIGAISDASALLLPANARLRFSTPRVPHHDAPGVFLSLESKLDVGLTFRAWDQTTGVAGGRGDASVNGGATAFSTSTETARVYFEARLFRHFNRTAELNIYTLEAEFNALAAFNDPAFEDRSTDAWTGFTVLLSPVPELATTALYRMYYGVQFNTNGTEIDMGYRYLTTNLLEAQALENSGPADKRPQRAGAYFREQGVNAGTGVLGYIYTTQQPGTQQMRQMYRADIVQKPTRPAGTAEGGTPTSFTPQESGDHVYTTNTAFESTKTGTWRVESAPGFVRPLGGQGLIAPATAAGTALAGTNAEPVVRSGTTAVATTTDLVDAFITPRQILATAGVIAIDPLASTATIPLGLIAIPAAPVSVPATVATLEADDDSMPSSSSLVSTEDSALGELDALFTTIGNNAFDLAAF